MATSVLEFISKIPGQSDMYTTPIYQKRIGRIRTQTPAFDEFIWAFRDGRHKDCLSTAQDVLFQRMLPGAMGVPPMQTHECIKRMIPILERGTPALKERWIGHPSIPPRVLGPSQYLIMPPVRLTKPRLTLKPLHILNSILKLVPPETQSDAEECQWVQLTAGGATRRVTGADAAPINNFVQWFQAISANMNAEAQKRALVASRKAASSVFTDVGDDEASSIAVQAAPIWGDVRRVEYSAEMAGVGFLSQSSDQGGSLRERQLELNKLQPAGGQSDLRLPPPKCS